MPVYGSKYVHYFFLRGRWTVVRYPVCGIPYPVVSVAGRCCLGYNVNFSYHKMSVLWRNHRCAEVTADRGPLVSGMSPTALSEKNVEQIFRRGVIKTVVLMVCI